MFEIFQEEPLISVGILVFMGISLFVRILLGALYRNMIKEADNMATTDNKLLKQCKLKFANCYQLNNGVSNIPIFVDKFLNKLALGPFPFDTLYHLSGQCMLLSVICAGIGVCRSIVLGRTLGEILPFYIISFAGLYLYFSVSSIVDIKTHKRILKVNLVDYLENHLSARIGVTENDIEMLYGEEIPLRGRQMRLSSGERAGRGRRTVELMPIGNRWSAEPAQTVVFPVAAGQGMSGQGVPVQGAVGQGMAETVNTASFQITEEELEALIKEFV